MTNPPGHRPLTHLSLFAFVRERSLRPSVGDVAVSRIEFDPHGPSLSPGGCNENRSGPRERIEDDSIFRSVKPCT